MPDDNLNDLNAKLTAYRDTRQNGAPRNATPESRSMNDGARAGIELVTSVLAGGAIGWALDHWLGTRPWCLIIFIFLGVGTGFMSVYRITNNLGAVGFAPLQNAQKPGTKPPQISDDDEDE